MAHYKYVVFTEPMPGREDEYNDWYTNIHLNDLLALDGFVAAQRFKIVDIAGNSQAPGRYMAIYDIETEDPAAVLGQLADPALTSGMALTDALNLSTARTILYSPITDRVVRP